MTLRRRNNAHHAHDQEKDLKAGQNNGHVYYYYPRRISLRYAALIIVVLIVILFAITKEYLTSKRNDNDELPDIHYPPQHIIDNNNNQCAILLFGTPRSFTSVVLPMLKQHVILPNLKYSCDYYVHINSVEYEDVPLYQGSGGHISNPDVVARELENAILRNDTRLSDSSPVVVRFVNSTRLERFKRHRELYLKTHLLQDESGHWVQYSDVIQSYDGITMAWNLMESENRSYNHVAVVGLHTIYIDPLDIYHLYGSGNNIVISDASPNAFGPYEAMKIWVTERFNHIYKHVSTFVATGIGSPKLTEGELLKQTVLPILEKKRFLPVTIQCSLDVLPDNSVVLEGCNDNSRSKGQLEKVLGEPCVLIVQQGMHRCIFDSEKHALWEVEEKRKVNEFSILTWLFPSKGSSSTKNQEAVVCCIVSNEEAYLDEWIDYNIGIGFAHIYIYDNTADFDMGRGWLERRPRLFGRVTLHHFPGAVQQPAAYRDCGKRYAKNHQWVGFFDVDEFLVLREHTNVVQFLLDYGILDGQISINQERMSWRDQLQFSPHPVTQRFQAEHDVFRAVKSIASVSSLADEDHHPHFAKLKSGLQIDTNGRQIKKNWYRRATPFNFDFPSNVSTFYHYHTKSWKEYIMKRMRGRSDREMSNELNDAKAGIGLLNTTKEGDSSAWDILQSVSPKYHSLFAVAENNLTANEFEIDIRPRGTAICVFVSDQEAYIEEWVDYHLGAGFSHIYIVDSSEDFWMRQSFPNNSHVLVTHFPGNVTNISDKAKALSDCAARHGKNHDFIAFVEAGCAQQYSRVVFGTGGQYVYEPIPTTKRFVFRVDEKDLSQKVPDALILRTSNFSGLELEKLHDDFDTFLRSNRWNSNICKHTGDEESSPTNVAVYHYLRSTKECKKERGKFSTLCSLKGTVEDQFGWDQSQYFQASYAHYNDFL